MKLIIFVSILFSTMVGCASIQPQDMSHGSSEKAIIYPAQYRLKHVLVPDDYYQVQIVSVDNEELSGWESNVIYISPGEHVLKVRVFPPNNGGLASYAIYSAIANKSIGVLNVNIEKNKKYQLKAEITDKENYSSPAIPKRFVYSLKEYSGNQSPVYEVSY